MKGYDLFWSLRSRSNGSQDTRGPRRRPAVCLLSGAVVAMDREVELAGVRSLLVSEHRFKKEKHRDDEQLTAKSTASSVRSEKE